VIDPPVDPSLFELLVPEGVKRIELDASGQETIGGGRGP
jgi:hypothetical protein